MRYLDPKNDLIFKKIFGEHPHLLMSFLNSVMPFDIPIVHIEYMPGELTPTVATLKLKNSIVDVRCKDQNGRQFIIEMQMTWRKDFLSRVFFNGAKAYVQQLNIGVNYKHLCPVYALALLNENFDKETSEFYHHFQMLNVADTKKQIEGLELIFIELKKFKPISFSEKKLMCLWLQFMNLTDGNYTIPSDLLEHKEIKDAVALLRASSLTKGEEGIYDKYWDNIRTRNTLESDRVEEGIEIGKEIGKEEGIEIGKEIGKEEGIEIGKEIGEEKGTLKVAINSIEQGLSDSVIASITGLDLDRIKQIRADKQQ